MLRVSVVASHPIQYQAPVWQAMARCPDVDLVVHFLTDHGHRPGLDRDFGETFAWDIDLLSGYEHTFPSRLATRRPGSLAAGLDPLVLARSLAKRDAVVVMGYASAGFLIAAAGAWLRRVPVYLRAETLDDQTRGRKPSGVSRAAWRAALRHIAGGFPIGVASERWYSERGVPAERLTRVGYGVDNARFARPNDQRIGAFRRDRLGIADNTAIALFAGKLIPRKDPLHAVDVVRSLRRAGRTIALVIAGSGPLEPDVRAALGGDDRLLGFVNQSELPMLYASADVTLVPSRFETWGLVVNESLAAGTPVVAAPEVPAAVELSGAAPDVVQVSDRTRMDAWTSAVEQILGSDRAMTAVQCARAVHGYDAASAGENIVERLRADATHAARGSSSPLHERP